MAHIVNDRLGREWPVTINAMGIGRATDQAGFNLMLILRDNGEHLDRLMSDPVLLIKVLFALIEPQITEAGLSPEEFSEGFAGDSLQSAADGILRAMADFLPSRDQRELLSQMIEIIDVEVEIAKVDKRTKAERDVINRERDSRIGGRINTRKGFEDKRQKDLQAVTDNLKDTLQQIADETARRNVEDAKAVVETQKAAQAAAEAAKAALDATIKAGGAALPTPKQVDENPGPASDPNTGKSPFDLLNEWKAARDQRDELKKELSGANRNGGVNPETGRSRDEINPEYQAARKATDDAMAGVERARSEQENNSQSQQAAKQFLSGIALPSATLEEQKAGAKSLAEATAGERKKLVQNEKGESFDPTTGKTLQQMIAEARKPSLSPTAVEQVRNARSGLDRLSGQSASLSSSTGTFSGRAAGQIGGSSVMSRMAKAAEATVKAVEANTAATQEVKKAVEQNAGLENE